MFQNRIKTHHSAMADGMKHVIGPKPLIEILSEDRMNDDKISTIYIHVPFCTKICSFCNMRRSLQNPNKEYANNIVREIENYATLSYIKETTFDAVYFGGGTPTTLSSEDLRKILRALKQNLHFTKDAEFTVETTVTQLTEEKMKILVAEGVNRFSVGVQTFDNHGRSLMGRIGSGEKAYECLRKLKSFPGVTVSMDLIYNYPKQTMESLYADLDKIITLDLDGFSMYSLINMKETTIDNAQEEENDEMMFYAIVKHMEKAGYQFLELTKMVKKDKYKYIMNRHHGADTLPLGAGAGGSIHGLAMMNPINLVEYEESINSFQNRKAMLFKESYKDIVRFKGDIQTTFLPRKDELYKNKETYIEFLDQLIVNEMVEKEGTTYRLTTKGIFWGNTISRELSSFLS